MSSFQLRDCDNDIQGRLALVTGASGGIGAACAKALAKEGCHVALHYSSSADTANRLAQELQQSYPKQHFKTHGANLSDRSATRNLVPSILQEWSSSVGQTIISILVANAGTGKRIRDPAHIEEEDWDQVFEVNTRSQFVVTKACLEGMRQQKWGRVILMGSIASHGGGVNGCHYAATKGAITSMGYNLATVLAPENVTVNIVSPAMIGSTGMVPAAQGRSVATEVGKGPASTAEALTSDLAKTDPGLAMASTIPVGRLGDPNEAANVVLMFAKTGYLTGQDVVLGGGLK